MDFYNKDWASFRKNMNSNRKYGLDDKVYDDYRKGVTTAAQKYIEQNVDEGSTNLSTNPKDYSINGGVWHYSEYQSNEYSKTPEKVYSPSEIPEAYRNASYATTEADEVKDILDQNVLITDRMIDNVIRAQQDNAKAYEESLDKIAEEFSKEKPNANLINTEYGKATLAGNNAITSKTTATAMARAQKEQRENPILYTKALVNTVSKKVSEISDDVVKAGSSFIKKLFGK